MIPIHNCYENFVNPLQQPIPEGSELYILKCHMCDKRYEIKLLSDRHVQEVCDFKKVECDFIDRFTKSHFTLDGAKAEKVLSNCFHDFATELAKHKGLVLNLTSRLVQEGMLSQKTYCEIQSKAHSDSEFNAAINLILTISTVIKFSDDNFLDLIKSLYCYGQLNDFTETLIKRATAY